MWAQSQLQRPEPSDEPPPLQDDRDRLAAGDRCILIIEDDLTFAKLLMERVRERGFSAIVATDGNSGIELAEKYQPSAILLDALLPRLDGWGVMQKISRQPANPAYSGSLHNLPGREAEGAVHGRDRFRYQTGDRQNN